MTLTPSFERINYSIRTNKNIERKIIFERLQILRKSFDIHRYRYLGLGSMWFVDFSLAHRLLSVQELRSFEHASPERAEYNKPFSCVSVCPGTSTKGLAELTPTEWTMPSVAWFDYDGAFTASIASDCRRLLTNLAAGSILIITVNANRRSYKPSVAADEGPPVINRLRTLFGNAVPSTATAGMADVAEEVFPEVFRSSLLAFLTGVVRTSGRSTAGKPVQFVPLFDFLHVDGTPMVTAGGMIASGDDVTALSRALDLEVHDVLTGKALIHRTIDLVPITIKEKIALDALLPCEEGDFPTRYDSSGLKLDLNEAMKYRELYSYFPVFAETVG